MRGLTQIAVSPVLDNAFGHDREFPKHHKHESAISAGHAWDNEFAVRSWPWKVKRHEDSLRTAMICMAASTITAEDYESLGVSFENGRIFALRHIQG